MMQVAALKTIVQGILLVVLLPATPEQLERWSRPRPEPVTLDLPGWTKSPAAPDPAFPNQSRISFVSGACSVVLVRYWDLPLDPGYPITVLGSKPVTVAGRSTELVTVKKFGSELEERVSLTGQGYDVEYHVGVRFQNCPEDVVNDVLKRVEIHW
jgi:hypothetical protein